MERVHNDTTPELLREGGREGGREAHVSGRRHLLSAGEDGQNCSHHGNQRLEGTRHVWPHPVDPEDVHYLQVYVIH